MSLFDPVLSVIGTIVPFLFVLTVVVFVHEMGHFLVGRLCGVKVDAFSLGFGPELFARVDRWGTRWRIGAIPLGGYVKFHGDMNAASAQATGRIASMPADERAVTFGAQSVAERSAIVAAGPIANFILAIVIFTGIFYVQGRSEPHGSASSACRLRPILRMSGPRSSVSGHPSPKRRATHGS